MARGDREGREGTSHLDYTSLPVQRVDVIPNGGARPHPRVYPVTTLAVVGGHTTKHPVKLMRMGKKTFAPRHDVKGTMQPEGVANR